jgi:predicted nuclease of predicted toxin-antitoxin system
MRFLADMGVDVRVVAWLRQQAHDAKHLRDEGLQRSPNGEIFAKAVAENRVVLTFDLDFGEIAALTKGRKASIILFRLHNTRTPHVIDRLARALAVCAVSVAAPPVNHSIRHGKMPEALWGLERIAFADTQREKRVISSGDKRTDQFPAPKQQVRDYIRASITHE